MGHPHSTTFKSKPVWSVQLSLVCVCVCVVCRGVHVCSPWRANSGVAAALRCSDGGSYIRFPLWNKSRRAPVLLSPGPEPATTCHHQCSHLCWQQGFPYKGAWFFSFCMCVCAGVRVFGCVWVCVCAEKLLRQNTQFMHMWAHQIHVILWTSTHKARFHCNKLQLLSRFSPTIFNCQPTKRPASGEDTP